MYFKSKEMRAKIAAQLPDALDVAIESYNTFFKQKHNEDAKTFSAHHSACKAAIAHVQLLLKLAEWVEGDVSIEDAEHLRESRKAAEEELNRLAGL